MTKLISRIFTAQTIYIGLVSLIYLVAVLLPTPKDPVVSLKSIETMILGPSPAEPLPWQISIICYGIAAVLCFLALVIFCKNAMFLLSENSKMAKALGICLAIAVLVTPILFSLGSNIFSEPIGLLISMLSSLFAGVIAWVIILLISLLFSKEGKYFEEVKNDFVAAVEAKREKAPTE